MPRNVNSNGIESFNTVTEESVLEYIESLSNDKSIYDKIPMKIYKFIAPYIITPLVHILSTDHYQVALCLNYVRKLLLPLFTKVKVINRIQVIIGPYLFFLY